MIVLISNLEAHQIQMQRREQWCDEEYDMADKPATDENELIACQICLKEVPQSEAKIAEAQDYVMHFCGLDCYQQWQQKQANNSNKD